MATMYEFDNSDDFNMDDLDDTDELNKSIKALAEAILKYNTMVNVVISRTSANKMNNVSPDGTPDVSPDVSPDGTPRSDISDESMRFANTLQKRLYSSRLSDDSSDDEDNSDNDTKKLNNFEYLNIIDSKSNQSNGVLMIRKVSNTPPNTHKSIIITPENVFGFTNIKKALLETFPNEDQFTLTNRTNSFTVNLKNPDSPTIVSDQNVISENQQDNSGQGNQEDNNFEDEFAEMIKVSPNYTNVSDIVSNLSDKSDTSNAVPFTELSAIPVIRNAQELINNKHTKYNGVDLFTDASEYIRQQPEVYVPLANETTEFNAYQSALWTVAYGEMLDASIDILSPPEPNNTAGPENVDIQTANVLVNEPSTNNGTDNIPMDNESQIVSPIPYEPVLDASIDILSASTTPEAIPDTIYDNSNSEVPVDIDLTKPNKNIENAIAEIIEKNGENNNSIILGHENARIIVDTKDPNKLDVYLIPNINDSASKIQSFDNVKAAVDELRETDNLDENSVIPFTVRPVTEHYTEVADNSAITIEVSPDGQSTVNTPRDDNSQPYTNVDSALTTNPNILEIAKSKGESNTENSLQNENRNGSPNTEEATISETNDKLVDVNNNAALSGVHPSDEQIDNEVQVVPTIPITKTVIDLVPTSEQEARIKESNSTIEAKLKTNINDIKAVVSSKVYITETDFKNIIQEYGGLNIKDDNDSTITDYIDMEKMQKYVYKNDGKYIKAEHNFKLILSMLYQIKTRINSQTGDTTLVDKIIKYYKENIERNDSIDETIIQELKKLVDTLPDEPKEIKKENDKLPHKLTAKEEILETIKKIQAERKYINIQYFLNDLVGRDSTENAKYDIIEILGKYSREAGDANEEIDHANQQVITQYIEKSIKKNITEISYISNNFDVLQKIFRQIQLTKDRDDIYKINEFNSSNVRQYDESGYTIKLPEIFSNLEKLQYKHEPKDILQCLLFILKIDPKELMKIYEKIYTHVINLVSVILYLFTDGTHGVKLGHTIGREDPENARFITIKSLDKILLEDSSFIKDKVTTSYIKPNMIVYDYFTRNKAKLQGDIKTFNEEYKNLKTLLDVCLKIIEYVLQGSTVTGTSSVEHPPSSTIGRMLQRSQAYTRSGESAADLNIITRFVLELTRYKGELPKSINNLNNLHTYGNDLYNGTIKYNKIYEGSDAYKADKDVKVLQYIKAEPGITPTKQIDPKFKDVAIDVAGTDLQTQQQLKILNAPTGRNRTLERIAPMSGQLAPLKTSNKQILGTQSPRITSKKLSELKPVIPPPNNKSFNKTQKTRPIINPNQELRANTWEQGTR